MYGLHKPIFLDSGLKVSNVPVPRPRERAANLISNADPIDLTVAIIAQMATECDKRNCRLVVMKFGLFLFPDNRDFMELDRQCERQVLESPGILYLDLDYEFAKRGLTLEILTEGNHDQHWNALGHRETGMILYQFLVDAGQLI